MKLILYFYFIGTLWCAITQAVFAQNIGSAILQTPFVKGSWQVGLKDGYGASPLIGNRNTTQLTAGYYVVNRLLIGLAGSYTRELAEFVSNRDIFLAGPLLRYQFIAGRIAPYTELAYQLGRRSTHPEQSLSFTPGLSFGLLTGLRMDLSYSFQYINYSGRGYGPFRQPLTQPQVSINYLFSAR